MCKPLIFGYHVYRVITSTVTKYVIRSLLYGGSSSKSFRQAANTTLTQVREVRYDMFPGKAVCGVVHMSVPQTNTGGLVEYTKANE